MIDLRSQNISLRAFDFICLFFWVYNFYVRIKEIVISKTFAKQSLVVLYKLSLMTMIEIIITNTTNTRRHCRLIFSRKFALTLGKFSIYFFSVSIHPFYCNPLILFDGIDAVSKIQRGLSLPNQNDLLYIHLVETSRYFASMKTRVHGQIDANLKTVIDSSRSGPSTETPRLRKRPL